MPALRTQLLLPRKLLQHLPRVSAWWGRRSTREDKSPSMAAEELVSPLRLVQKASASLLPRGIAGSVFSDSAARGGLWHCTAFKGITRLSQLEACEAQARQCTADVTRPWSGDLYELHEAIHSWCPAWQAVEEELLSKPEVVQPMLKNPRYPNAGRRPGGSNQALLWHRRQAAEGHTHTHTHYERGACMRNMHKPAKSKQHRQGTCPHE